MEMNYESDYESVVKILELLMVDQDRSPKILKHRSIKMKIKRIYNFWMALENIQYWTKSKTISTRLLCHHYLVQRDVSHTNYR